MADFTDPEEVRRHIRRSIDSFSGNLPSVIAMAVAKKLESLGAETTTKVKGNIAEVSVAAEDEEQRLNMAKIVRKHVEDDLPEIAEKAWPDWG